MTDSSSPSVQDSAKTAFRIWSIAAPFRKDGTPVMGTFGQTMRSVVLMEHSTWKRLVEAHPDLATEQFEVGEYV